jgi:hypothetical protein
MDPTNCDDGDGGQRRQEEVVSQNYSNNNTTILQTIEMWLRLSPKQYQPALIIAEGEDEECLYRILRRWTETTHNFVEIVVRDGACVSLCMHRVCIRDDVDMGGASFILAAVVDQQQQQQQQTAPY